MDNFDPYNILLAIATNVPQQLKTGFVVQGHIGLLLITFEVRWKWHTPKYGDPYSEFMLYILPIQVHTHTVNTHPEQWAAIYAAAPAEQLVVRALLKGTSSWYWRWRECCTFTPPTDNPCRTETQTHKLSIMCPTWGSSRTPATRPTVCSLCCPQEDVSGASDPALANWGIAFSLRLSG